MSLRRGFVHGVLKHVVTVETEIIFSWILRTIALPEIGVVATLLPRGQTDTKIINGLA